MPWGSILGAGASIIGGLIGAKGQRDANAANAQIARENRNWQERMSNTAYQRAAVDLNKAGLNRILALGNPATTPGGNVATMGNVGAAAVEGASNAANTALAVRQQKILKATEQNINADTMKKKSETSLNQGQEWMLGQQALKLQGELDLLLKQGKLTEKDIRLRGLQGDVAEMESALKSMDLNVYRANEYLRKLNALYKEGSITFKTFATFRELGELIRDLRGVSWQKDKKPWWHLNWYEKEGQ